MMMFATPFEDYIPPPEFVKALDLIFLYTLITNRTPPQALFG